MILRTGGAIICAVSLLTLPALAATPPKAAKPAATKSAGAKAAPAKPAAAKPAAKASTKPAATKPAAQTSYKLPTGGKPEPVPPPPASLTTPAPQQPAAKAAAPAKPAAQAAAPAQPKAKKAAKKAGKKKQIAGTKGKKIKNGRAALSPIEKIDRGQLATDHLSGAEHKSTLDLLVSYKDTLRQGDLETAGVLLRLIANETPSHEVATAVNDLIGLPLDTQETEILIAIAKADRADAVAGDTAKKAEEEKVSSPLGERIHAAHAAVEAAPRTSRIEALAAYKHAVTEGNAEAAAVALTGVVQGPLNEATVNTANALLGVENIISPDKLASVN